MPTPFRRSVTDISARTNDNSHGTKNGRITKKKTKPPKRIRLQSKWILFHHDLRQGQAGIVMGPHR